MILFSLLCIKSLIFQISLRVNAKEEILIVLIWKENIQQNETCGAILCSINMLDGKTNSSSCKITITSKALVV